MKKRSKAQGRTAKIRAYLARSKTAKTLHEICEAIGASADETKYVAAIVLRLTEAKELRRKDTDEGFRYRAA